MTFKFGTRKERLKGNLKDTMKKRKIPINLIHCRKDYSLIGKKFVDLFELDQRKDFELEVAKISPHLEVADWNIHIYSGNYFVA
jgi:hypothetical protein